MDAKTVAHLLGIVKELRASDAAWPFLAPVDWKGLCLDDYPLVVTELMDLKTVAKKLKQKQYKSPAQFWRDVNLIWYNCKTFNSESAEVFRLAVEMENLTKGLKASFEDVEKLAPQQASNSSTPHHTATNPATVSSTPVTSNKSQHQSSSGSSSSSSSAPRTAFKPGKQQSIAKESLARFSQRLNLLNSTFVPLVLQYLTEQTKGAVCIPVAAPSTSDLSPAPTSEGFHENEPNSPSITYIQLDVELLYSKYHDAFQQADLLVSHLLKLSENPISDSGTQRRLQSPVN